MEKSALIEKLEDIEWEDFEVKEAKSEIPKSSWETVSAFSNTAGGWIIFGISKKGKSYDIIGVSNPEKIEQNFTTILRNGTKFNKKVNVKSKKYKFNDKFVLAFYIPQKSSREKPIYFNSQKNTFIRTGSGDQRATQEEIDSFFRTSSFEEKDKELTGYQLKDLDKTSIEKYRIYFSNVNPGHRYNALTDSDFLHKLGILIDNRVTYGGLLVFGSEDLLIQTMTNYKIEYLEIPGTSYEDAPTRYSFRISSEQNLFITFFDIYERLIKKVEIPFSIKRGVRDDDPSHLQALREALVNLIIHTDYFSKASPRIRVFSNRFEFFNPGSLPKKIEYILKEDFSLPRNPIIAKIFRFVKLAENIGSGFHKMINGWDQSYGLKPIIEGDFDYYKITFPGTTAHKTVEKKQNLSREELLALLVEKVGSKLVEKVGSKLVENQLKIILLISEDEKITKNRMSEILNISNTAIDKNILKLKNLGIIKRVGPDKGGHWEVME